MTRTRRALWLVLLALAAVVPYLPGLPGEFVYDDRRLIVDNEGLKRPFDARRAFGRDYYASDDDRMGLGYYRPVAILLNEFDYRRQGGSPSAFHTTNLVVHAAATVLVFLLARRVFAGREWVAGAAGLLFAVHPCHAESVAFISGRVDPLATTFALAAALLHLWSSSAFRPTVWRWAAAGAWLAALLSKEIAVTAPALIFLLESAEIGFPRRRDLGERMRRYIPYAVVFAVYLAARWFTLGGLLGMAATSTRATVWQAPVVMGSYLAWLILPPPGLHLEPAPVGGLRACGAVLLFALTVAGAWHLIRKGLRTEAALVGWCLLALLPVIQIRPIETDLSERFLYLSSAGAAILLARLADSAARSVKGGSRRISARAVPLVLGVAYVAILEPRALAWRDAAKLWTQAAAEDPTSLKAHLNLGRELAGRGEIDGARRAFERATAIKPELAAATKAEFAIAAGSRSGLDVIQVLRAAAAAEPWDAAVRADLGFALLQSGQSAEAVGAFRESVALVSSRSPAWLGLALAELHTGNVSAAADAAQRALAIDPELDLAKLALAECTLRLGKPCVAERILAPLVLEDAGEAAARDQLFEAAQRECAGS